MQTDRLDSFRGPTLAEHVEMNRLVGTPEIAEMIGKSKKTVLRYSASGFRGFPPPIVDVGQRRWRHAGNRLLGQSVAYLKRKLAIVHKATIHSIRHTVATKSLRSGSPITYVSLLLGHNDQRVTQNVYSHVTTDYEQIRDAAAAGQPTPEALDGPGILKFRSA